MTAFRIEGLDRQRKVGIRANVAPGYGLADRLVESLDPAEGGELHRLWAEEAQRRLQELRSGDVESIPGEEAVARLHEKYGR